VPVEEPSTASRADIQLAWRRNGSTEIQGPTGPVMECAHP
jgi:hypothetical protein